MSPLISFGISLITAFQSMGPWLEAPMKFFSFLGSEDFFLVFLPLIYWSGDAALGIRVLFICEPLRPVHRIRNTFCNT